MQKLLFSTIINPQAKRNLARPGESSFKRFFFSSSLAHFFEIVTQNPYTTKRGKGWWHVIPVVNKQPPPPPMSINEQFSQVEGVLNFLPGHLSPWMDVPVWSPRSVLLNEVHPPIKHLIFRIKFCLQVYNLFNTFFHLVLYPCPVFCAETIKGGFALIAHLT